jgi:RNA polymerase sigma-70 factor, ECF subfamily
VLIECLVVAALLASEQGVADLTERIRAGDRQAFREVFETWHRRLLGFLVHRGIPVEAAEDIVQHAFVSLWEARSRLSPGHSLPAYLYRVCTTRAYNYWRDAKPTVDIDTVHIGQAETPQEDAEYAELVERVRDVLKRLPDRRRLTFELCFIQGLTYSEAAESMGVSPRTVEHQMAHAFKALRTQLADLIP